jgi:filamentous hemagglutinin family protein
MGATIVVPLMFDTGAIAQVRPAPNATDTEVLQRGDRFIIQGGQTSRDGANLFHQFESFGLSADQVANFLADPSTQRILGQVVGGDASVINGLIRVSQSNADLYLINPAGILFGDSARLDIPGSLTATTANGIGFGDRLWDAFSDPNYRALVGEPTQFFFSPEAVGSVVNAGNLRVPDGESLRLLGGTVLNTGTLSAPGGEVTVMAVSGGEVLRMTPEGALLSLEVTPLPRSLDLATVPFDPLTLPQLLTDGQAYVPSVQVMPNGTVQLVGSGLTLPTESGDVVLSGRILTRSETGQPEINIGGDRIALLNANLNASGADGGTIRIGGEYRGGEGLPSAQFTTIDAQTVISANGILPQSDGGRVIVWADDTTQFAGLINARGRGGEGSFVEISGRDNLRMVGNADLRNPNGTLGTLLLDPENIRVVASGGGANDAQLPTIFGDDRPNADFTISEAALEAIAPTAEIILEARNNITIEEMIDGELNFSINRDDDGSLSPGASITFRADSDNDGVGNFVSRSQLVAIGRDVILEGVNVTFGNVRVEDAGDIEAASLTIIAGRDVNVLADVQTGNSGGINITAGRDINLTTGLTSLSNVESIIVLETPNGGDINLTAGRDINENGGRPASTLDATDGRGAFTVADSRASTNVRVVAGRDVDLGTIVASRGRFGNRPPEVSVTAGRNIQLNSVIAASGFIELIAGEGFLVSDAPVGNFSVRASPGGSGPSGFIRIQAGSDERPFIVGDDATTFGVEGSIEAVENVSFNDAELFETFRDPDLGIEIILGANDPGIPVSPLPSPSPSPLPSPLPSPAPVAIDPPDIRPDSPPLVTPPTAEAIAILSQDEAQDILLDIGNATGVQPALIYIQFISPQLPINQDFVGQETALTQDFINYFDNPGEEAELALTVEPQATDQLEILLVPPSGNPIRYRVNATREDVLAIAQQFRSAVTDRRSRPEDYLPLAQQLHGWFMKPIASDLEQLGIENLSFVMDDGLRSLPMAALHDGNEFIINQYSLGMMPSLSLVETTYTPTNDLQVLAMGASEFETLPPLPNVPDELEAIATLWPTTTQLNEPFTVENLRNLRNETPYGIVHLATHGFFEAGNLDESYLQFWDGVVTMDEFRSLQLNAPTTELLVLSACQTALGDRTAELGFAGLAHQTGVKSVLASLWFVSDEATRVLMTEFYTQLQTTPIKAEALRLAQQRLASQTGRHSFAHPYYWSAFTLIGNPW